MQLRNVLPLVATMIVAGVSLAAAQEVQYPDMTGKWTGETEAVMIGNPLHYEPIEDELSLRSVEISLVIDGQDGRRIWGTVQSATGDSEPFVAVLRDGGTRYLGVDSDGYMEGLVMSENEIEHCYTHTNTSMIAVCVMMRR